MKTSLRCALLGFLLGHLGFAWAQSAPVDATPKSPAQSLSCLQQPSEPLKFPERDKLDHGWGMIRVQLFFEKADAKPRVEVLANTAREDMQDLVFRRLAQYRLPCLTAEDGVVNAVQEFNFNNTDREPLPIGDGEPKAEVCIVMPRKGVDGAYLTSRKGGHLMLAIIFDGEDSKPANVKVLYSTGYREFERAAVRYANEYRMPCRSTGAKTYVLQQAFFFQPDGASRYGFKREAFGLGEFLGMTKGARELEANFDLNTMNCPFKVNYRLYGPNLPNEVSTGGKPDPNRAAFLQWLSERQIAFENEQQARDLWGSTLQIKVPCGVLKLERESAATSAAPANGKF